MQRAAVAVALLVVLSGCNAFGGGGGGQAETATLTPVEVPTDDPLGTRTETPTACLAPAVAAGEQTPVPAPATAAPLPGENGTVRGSDLVARHRATLSNYSYALRMDSSEVRAMPGAVAFTYEGVSLGFRSVQVFAVAGTVYTLQQVDGGVAVRERPYRPDSAAHQWYVDALTGSDWLTEWIGRYNYTRVGTRTWNGTEVRVLRDTLDRAVLVGAGETLSVDSTVLVDRRGIVRQVRHVRTVRTDTGTEIVNTTEIRRFSVPEVGSVTVTRPEEFCVPESAVVTPEQRNGTAGGPVVVAGTAADTAVATDATSTEGAGPTAIEGTSGPTVTDETSEPTSTEGAPGSTAAANATR